MTPMMISKNNEHVLSVVTVGFFGFAKGLSLHNVVIVALCITIRGENGDRFPDDWLST